MPPSRVPVIAVHGFMYDPADKGGANDPAGFFQEMSGIVGQPVIPFAWYSAPFGLRLGRPFRSAWQTARAWLGSWTKGFLDPYKYAWTHALAEGERLRQVIRLHDGPVDIVAHSLGVRVALDAIWGLPAGKVRRVVFFNGAELAENADQLAPLLPRDVEVLNFAISTDRVLEWLGAIFNGQDIAPCIGRVGLPHPQPNWHDLFLDRPEVAVVAMAKRRWTIRAYNPADLLGHGESYHFAGNTDLVRAWLAGDMLSDLTAIRG